jgi:hypothetical protein
LALGAATAAAASSPGCAWQGFAARAQEALGGIDVHAYLAEIDRTIEAMTNPLGGILARRKDGKKIATDPKTRELVRKSLQSLVLVSAFHDLPEDARLHPAVQARMWNAMPDMDDAVVGMTSLLGSLTPAQRDRAIAELKKQPDLPMEVAESIDQEASAVGFNDKGRVRLRGLASTLSWRLERQPPGLVLADGLGKMERIVAKRGSEAQRERLIAMELTQAAFWSAASSAAQTTATSTASDEPGASRTREPEREMTPPTLPPKAPRDRVRRAPDPEPGENTGEPQSDAANDLLLGGLALGFGVASIGAGAFLIAAEVWVPLGVTAGALLVVLGISLLIGGVISLITAGAEAAGAKADLPGG